MTDSLDLVLIEVVLASDFDLAYRNRLIRPEGDNVWKAPGSLLAAFALVRLDELPDPVIPPSSDQFVVHYTQAQPVLYDEGFCGACLRQFYCCYGFRGNGRR